MKIQGSGQGALLLDSAPAAIDEILAGLGRQRMYAASIVGTAGVGNFAIAQVTNPNGSGKTLYFLLGDLFVATSMAVAAVFDGTTIATIQVPVPMFDAGPASVAAVGGGNQAAATGTHFINSPALAINTPYLLPSWFWCALPPNHNLQLQGQVANAAFTVNLRWIELSN